MRNNQPVTRREYQLRGDDFLVSRTDRGGRITYANPAFIEASGFTLEELQGQPHNLVRHPSMPKEAFANLWETLKSGQTWIGLVKNRRKNGDFYWVKAHVAPIIENGEVQGYVSMRTQASREAIAAAEEAYTVIREGRGRHLYLSRGELRERGLVARLRHFNFRSLHTRLLALAGLLALLLVVSAAIGLTGVARLESTGLRGVLMTTLWLVLAVSLALLGGLVALVRSGMFRPLREAMGYTVQIAAGNLSARPPLAGRDEMGGLMAALDVMCKSLSSIVGDVNAGVRVVTPEAREIAVGNADLSARTDQQAAFLEETAASMEELTATVKQNADNAREASALAQDTSVTASRGGEVVEQVISTMRDISDESRKIADITSLIDTIAFQTNVLALNASVEAARAGEQGRGFAVVAGEVRSLAGRSAEAAREIKILIDNSVQQVSQGAVLVEKAGDTMREVVASVKNVTAIVDQIAAASQEQSNGIEQVNQAVNQMGEVTQQNAALVQRAAAAAASLEEQTTHLGQAMAVILLATDRRADANESDGEPWVA